MQTTLSVLGRVEAVARGLGWDRRRTEGTAGRGGGLVQGGGVVTEADLLSARSTLAPSVEQATASLVPVFLLTLPPVSPLTL